MTFINKHSYEFGRDRLVDSGMMEVADSVKFLHLRQIRVSERMAKECMRILRETGRLQY